MADYIIIECRLQYETKCTTKCRYKMKGYETFHLKCIDYPGYIRIIPQSSKSPGGRGTEGRREWETILASRQPWESRRYFRGNSSLRNNTS